MLYCGEFISETGHRIRVEITTGRSTAMSVEIGSETSGIYFTDEEPVIIESQVNDTFDRLLCNNATIKLLTDHYIADFYNADCTDASVTIARDGEIVFSGFIEPYSYSQGFSSVLEETDLNCIDVLTALQYRRWAGADIKGADYDNIKSLSGSMSVKDILSAAFGSVAEDIHIFYDGSKALDEKSAGKDLLSQVSLETLLFFGDEKDDVWTTQEVTEEILRYFNLHALQSGRDIYLFAWETLQKANNSITFYNIATGEARLVSAPVIEISKDNARGTDAKISSSEVYSRISVKDDVTAVEDFVSSPLEKDFLQSKFSGRQSYLSEMITGTGATELAAQMAFRGGADIDAENSEGYIASSDNAAKLYLHFIQSYGNKYWRFKLGDGSYIDTLETGHDQQDIPNALAEKRGAALLKVGTVNIMGNSGDDSPSPKISTSSYLVVAVNGNGVTQDTADKVSEPTEAQLKAMIPCAEYTGSAPGSILTPTDEATTNYIVISGKIQLCPRLESSLAYSEGYIGDLTELSGKMEKRSLEIGSGHSGYIQRRYYKHYNPSDLSQTDKKRDNGLYFPIEEMPEQLEMKYNTYSQEDVKGTKTDFTSKIPVLQCMLVVGDKCLVETGTGTTSDPYKLSWQQYTEYDKISRATEAEKEEAYYAQSFSIGFNPKIGDHLIGQEYDIANTVDYRINIDTTGTAIPIKKGDALSGQVKFAILGPVNWTYSEVLKRHKTMFRHTKWSTKDIALLSQVSSIFVKDLNIKLYTDNGLTTDKDNDIVYTSLTADSFVNKKDDIEFKITSALTKAECSALSVAAGVWLSSPTAGSLPITALYNRLKAESAKPEQDYIDSAYTEWHMPRVILEQAVDDSRVAAAPWAVRFTHPALEHKSFFVQAYGRDLMAGTVNYTLKEIPS